jgi:branched-chain amino acid transport system permease protein
MRMVIFSVLLVVVMIFARKGIMGGEEFFWQWLVDLLKGFKGSRV